jgi:hypothetical protein
MRRKVYASYKNNKKLQAALNTLKFYKWFKLFKKTSVNFLQLFILISYKSLQRPNYLIESSLTISGELFSRLILRRLGFNLIKFEMPELVIF